MIAEKLRATVVLTATLREMERDGLVDRTIHAEVPPRVEYTLTDLGRSLTPILDAMVEWGVAYNAVREPGEVAMVGE